MRRIGEWKVVSRMGIVVVAMALGLAAPGASESLAQTNEESDGSGSWDVNHTVDTGSDSVTVSLDSDLENGSASYEGEGEVTFDTVEDNVSYVPDGTLNELSVIKNGVLEDVLVLEDPWHYRTEATTLVTFHARDEGDGACEGEAKLGHHFANVTEENLPPDDREIVVNNTWKLYYDDDGQADEEDHKPEVNNTGNPVVTNVSHSYEIPDSKVDRYEVKYEVRINGTTTEELPWLTIENKC